MEITATVKAKLPMVSGSSARGEWKKQTIVVSWMDGNYEQNLALDNLKNADNFAALPIGATFKFSCNVSSREHKGNWYTSVVCWKWEPAAAAAAIPTQATPQYAPAPQQMQPMQMQAQQQYNVPQMPTNTTPLPF